ncbi:oxidation resistance protein 1, partial [Spiromyces aspiralis]
MFIRHPPRQKPNPSPPLESPPPSQQGRRHTASSPTTPLPESMTRKLWASESPPPLVSVDNDSSDEAEKHNSGDSAAGGFFSRTFARFKSTFSNNFGTFSQPFPRSFTDTFNFVASSSPSSGLDTTDAGGNWDLRVRPHLRPAVTTATTSCLRQVRERGSLGDIPFSPKLEGRNHETPKVLTKAIAREIQQHVPRRIRLARTWRLLYSLEQHGTSIRTLYKRVERKGPVLLAIKDTRGHVFGAYLSDPPRIEPNFYGNGTCFLWRAYRAPFGEKRKLLEEDDDDDGAEVKEKGGKQDNNSPSRAVAVRVYNSTGDN